MIKKQDDTILVCAPVTHPLYLADNKVGVCKALATVRRLADSTMQRRLHLAANASTTSHTSDAAVAAAIAMFRIVYQLGRYAPTTVTCVHAV